LTPDSNAFQIVYPETMHMKNGDTELKVTEFAAVTVRS